MHRGAGCVGDSLGARLSTGCSGTARSPETTHAQAALPLRSSELPRLDMRWGAGCVGDSLGARVSTGCSDTAKAPPLVRVAEIGHAPGRRLCGRQLGSQGLDGLLRHSQIARDDGAQASLLLQRKVRAIKTLPATLLQAAQPIISLRLRHGQISRASHIRVQTICS